MVVYVDEKMIEKVVKAGACYWENKDRSIRRLYFDNSTAMKKIFKIEYKSCHDSYEYAYKQAIKNIWWDIGHNQMYLKEAMDKTMYAELTDKFLAACLEL